MLTALNVMHASGLFSNLPIPEVLVYLIILLAVVLIWFLALKRPVYEAVLVAFVTLVACSGTWGQLWEFIETAISEKTLFSMTAFVAMSVILTKTKVMDGVIAIILALLGRIPGGTGYVSVLASSFMGAMSGSGPGNIMATGSMTIPAMKKSGFPAELAANIVSNSSYMGNMIPPSNNILVSYDTYMLLLGASAFATAAAPNIGVTEFWLVMWGISIWFVLHRLLMVFIFCKVYKIKAMPKEELPDLKTSLKEHWQGLLLPVIIMAPFVLDFLFKDNFFTARLGAAGAKNFANAALLFIPGVATIYGFFITKDKSLLKPKVIIDEFGGAIKTIAPTVGVCLFGYMIGALFSSMNFDKEMTALITSLHINKLLMVILICIFTTIMGMIIPGSAIIKMFGGVCITALYSVGVNPLLAAAMLPVICGVMCGITPPLGLGLYAGMSIAGSDFDKTVANNWWWVITQFLMQVVILMGLLPIFGL